MPTECQDEELDEAGVTFHQGADKKSADVGGAPYSFDRALYNMVQKTKRDRTGGFWTRGTKSCPHVINLTGDGDGLGQKNSGVHFSAALPSLSQKSVPSGAREKLSVCVWVGRGRRLLKPPLTVTVPIAPLTTTQARV